MPNSSGVLPGAAGMIEQLRAPGVNGKAVHEEADRKPAATEGKSQTSISCHLRQAAGFSPLGKLV